MTEYKQLVYIKWNDACEAEDHEGTRMELCVQETAGFLADIDMYGNHYVARDYNTMNEMGERFERVIRIPRDYIIEMELFEL